MILSSLHALNYRTLENVVINFAGDYSTISGQNNAGKSSVMRLLSAFDSREKNFPWLPETSLIDFNEDKTQWLQNGDPIVVTYQYKLTVEDDPALISFIERIAQTSHPTPELKLTMIYKVAGEEDFETEVIVNNVPVDSKASKEINKRMLASNIVFTHNSTVQHDDIFFERGKRRAFFELNLTEQERSTLQTANKAVETKLKRFARQHVNDLTEILGKLAEKYEVELSPMKGMATRRLPLGINLKDKSVQVPINEWGSGTQNRTHIIMAILRASRIKKTASTDDKITPIVVIEEPESFLHPSAQAEFGRLLRNLSQELGIQIIVSTHSPFMLNQENPAANILLKRKIAKNKPVETVLVDTSAENWMAPFAEHLGIEKSEFKALRAVFSTSQTKALLVEGVTDKAYFEYLQNTDLNCSKLSRDIEVHFYEGKDAIKNSAIIKLVLGKFEKFFLTYDLDAVADCASALKRANVPDSDHMPLGVLASPGRDCIEGLLPLSVLSAVNGRQTELVMAASSNGSQRKSAKNQLKQHYLTEFQSRQDYSCEELSEFNKAILRINEHFS